MGARRAGRRSTERAGTGKLRLCRRAAADLGPSMQCSVCQWVYDPATGEPNQDVQPGTPWSEVPDNFLCPECSLGKEVFDVPATEAV